MNRIRTLAMAAVVASPLTLGAVSTHASDIVETAIEAGNFNTLVAAVEAAGLVEVLSGDGPFTVFAPTDEAFAALPEGTIEMLLEPENVEQLVAILTYHVVPGEVPASAAAGSVVELETVQGQAVTVDGTGGGVTVDGANVIAADIEADNGIIHVIDTVILPSE